MNDIKVITQNDYSQQLKEFYEMSSDTISQIHMGVRLTKNRELSAEANQIKEQLKPLVHQIAANGDISKYNWQQLKSLIVISTRDMLISIQKMYPYEKSAVNEGFDDELDIILQFLCGFENKPPFTLQRICELLVEPEKHYRSSKKILFAMEKLVNVSS